MDFYDNYECQQVSQEFQELIDYSSFLKDVETRIRPEEKPNLMDGPFSDPKVLEAIFLNEQVLDILLSKQKVVEKISERLQALEISKTAEMDAFMIQDNDGETECPDPEKHPEPQTNTAGKASSESSVEDVKPSPSEVLPEVLPADTAIQAIQETKETGFTGIKPTTLSKIKEVFDFHPLYETNNLKMREKYKKREKALILYHELLRKKFKDEDSLALYLTNCAETFNLNIEEFKLIMFLFRELEPWLYIMDSYDELNLYDKIFNENKHARQLIHFYKVLSY